MHAQGRRAEDTCELVHTRTHSLLAPLTPANQPESLPGASSADSDSSEQQLLLVLLTAVRSCTAASYAASWPADSAPDSAAWQQDESSLPGSTAAQRHKSVSAPGDPEAHQQPASAVADTAQISKTEQSSGSRHRHSRSLTVLCPAVCEALSACLQLAKAACQAPRHSEPQGAAAVQLQQGHVQTLAQACRHACSQSLLVSYVDCCLSDLSVEIRKHLLVHDEHSNTLCIDSATRPSK